VIRCHVVQILFQIPQDLGPMNIVPPALPGQITEKPLVQQIPDADARQRSYMRICDMSKGIHGGYIFLNL
jgi:hypothetical protein